MQWWAVALSRRVMRGRDTLRASGIWCVQERPCRCPVATAVCYPVMSWMTLMMTTAAARRR